MGLAQRFKDKLEKKNIFEENTNSKELNFVSKPITDSFTVQPKELHSGVYEPVKNISELVCATFANSNYENLETEIIDKIRKTPYWAEYSGQQQEKMIGAYFEKRYKGEYTSSIKNEFIKNILALANNR